MAEKRPVGVSVDLKDVLSGLLMIAFAAGFAWLVLRPGGLALGSARSMGPGYFPLMVCMILAGLGIIMVATSFGRATGDVALVPLRSLVLVLLAPLVFASVVQPLGFVAAISTMVLISAWASYRMTLKWALLTAAGMTIFCIVLFYYLLQMPITLWGEVSRTFFK